MMKKRLIGTLAAFVLAAMVGYVAESSSLENATNAKRGTALKIMTSVLSGVSPYLGDALLTVPSPKAFHDLPPGLDEMAQTVLSTGIMGGFPDGSFRPDEELTRGEGLEIFGRAFDFIRSHLAQPQIVLEKRPVFEDVGPDHWLHPILAKLAGVGYSFPITQRRLFPSEPFTTKEALAIAAALIGYFGSEMIIGDLSGETIRILAKGTVSPISLQGWKYCWKSGPFEREAAWLDLPPQGMMRIPAFRRGMYPRLALSHEGYLPLEIQTVAVDSTTLYFLKLERRPPAARRPARADPLPMQFQANVPAEPLPMDGGETPVKGLPAPDDDRSRKNAGGDQEYVEAPPEEPSEANSPDRSVDVPNLAARPEREPSSLDDSSGVVQKFVYGTVIHGLTRKGIPGATILVNGRQVVTDADGRFVIPQVREPLLEMTVYCEGCESLFLKHRVGYRPGPLILALKPLQGTLEGRVEDAETGQPIAGASLTIGDRTVKADTAGKFSIAPLPWNYHQVSCQAPGYMETMELVHLDSRETFKVLRLNRVSRNLFGAVFDGADTPADPSESADH